MSEAFKFVDVSNTPAAEPDFWPTVVIPRAAIEAEVERLAASPVPSTGRRGSLIVHPKATGPGLGLAPGIDVTINVLKPGEVTPPILRNANGVDMCIRGEGTAHIGERTLSTKLFDVWNTPSMEAVSYRNDSKDLYVRLSYSNAPLLQKLQVLYVDENPITDKMPSGAPEAKAGGPRAREAAKPIIVGTDGAKLLGYEWLVDIDVVESKALIWPWDEVAKHLDLVKNLDLSYTGRHLYLLYNPATERRMGTSHSFFATIAKYPPGKVDRPHRHSSAAINYYFIGHGKSVVRGTKVEWEAGDLQLSAPGWAVHNHASREQGFCALTIQDHPLMIAMESLIWQETLKEPIIKLGSSVGVNTNLTHVAS